MKLSKTLIAVPCASFLIAAAVASGACNSSVSVNLPTSSMPPSDVTFPDGIKIGGDCSGTVFVDASAGYAFCDDNVWAYTTEDPTSTDSAYTAYGGGSESDSNPSDSSSANSASSNSTGDTSVSGSSGDTSSASDSNSATAGASSSGAGAASSSG